MKKITMLLGLLLLFCLLKSQTNILPDIELVPFASGFSSPLGIEHAGGDDLYVVEQTGKIRIVHPDGTWKSHFLNLSDKILTTGFEQGLLGLAFDPDYEENGYFYVHYTNLDGNSTISRFNVNPNNPKKALPSSELIMFVNDDPFANHNSGQLAFGPDGYFYFTIGDGGAGGDPFNNGQDLSTTFGKLMRVDPTDDGYDIPPSNPYAGMEGIAQEIWASGLRNPWRFSFDRMTGDLWIPDVGQNAWEEVNYAPVSSMGGENYGWSCREGLHFFEADCDDNGIPFTDPVAEYAHDESDEFFCSGSITGGFVYRGSQYPDMYGKYFYTDFCTGVIRTTYMYLGDWVTAELGNFTPFAYSTFGQDIDGELYLADKTSGRIYRFTDGGGGAFVSTENELVRPNIDELNKLKYAANDPGIDVDEQVREFIHQSPASDVTELEVEISPNPNNGQFAVNLTASHEGPYTATLRNWMGNVIQADTKEILKGENEWQFHSAELISGIYFLEIRSDNEISIAKFVVE